MEINDGYLELIEKFPELAQDDVNLHKEVYAHFGLLFFHFALIEHSIINILTLDFVRSETKNGKIKNKEDWENANDKGYNTAIKKTFGEMIKRLSIIPEYHSVDEDIKRINAARNYFSHHFFREDAGIYGDETGCIHIILKMQTLRNQISNAEEKLKRVYDEIRNNLGIGEMSKEFEEKMLEEIQSESRERIEKQKPFSGLDI